MPLTRIDSVNNSLSNALAQANKLIREVHTNVTSQSNEKLFYVDKTTGDVFERKPIFSRKDWVYYMVNYDEDFSYKGLTKEISELDNSYTVNIIINYKTRIKEDPPTELIRLLLSEKSVEEALNKRLLKWVSDFSGNEPGFVKRFYGLQEVLVKYIEDEASKLGLLIDIAISLKEGELITRPVVINGKMDIRVNDYFGKIPLSYNLDLEAIPEKRVDAIITLFNLNKLREDIESEIKKTIHSSKSTNLHTLYYDLQNEIREILFRKLDVFLDKFGLKPVFLNLDIQLQNLPPEREQFEYSIKCITKNKYDIVVNHYLILNLKNLGTYFSSGVTDLNDWIKKGLERITQDYLFDQEFTNLVTHFNGDSIKDEMIKEMEKIGYEIRQLITVPKLENIIPDYFNFEVGKENDFSTQQDDVKVKLNIIISGRIKGIDALKRYLNPAVTSNDIIQKMKEAVINSTRQFLHSIDSERYYMRFEYSDEENEIPVSELLKEKLKETLSTEFDAINLEIITKQLETELVSQFKNIREVPYTFIFENFPKIIVFRCPFTIRKVAHNGWYLFKAKCDAYQGKDLRELLHEIAQTMKNFIETKLDNFVPYDFKVIKGTTFMNEIENLLQSSSEVIEKEYGLIVQISKGLKRLPSPIEKKLQEVQELYENTRKTRMKLKIEKIEILQENQLLKTKTLLNKDNELLKNEDMDAEEIKEQLENLNSNDPFVSDFSPEFKEMESALKPSAELNLCLPIDRIEEPKEEE